MDGDNLPIGDAAGLDVGPDAAAVDNGDVSACGGAVGIGHQIAQVGFMVADGAGLAVGFHGGQVNGGLGHNLVQQGLILGQNALDKGVHGGILGCVIRNQFGSDGAAGLQNQLADSGQLGAGGGQENGLAVLVSDLLRGNGAVGMAVQEGGQTGDVGDDVRGAPGSALLVDPAVAHGDDVAGARGLGGVHSGLHGGIQLLAVVAAAEAVDILAGIILEIGGGRLGDGLGSVDAHIGHLGVAVSNHLVGVEHGLARPQVHEVAADVAALHLLGEIQELIHAVVKFVVAGDGHVIAHLVHDVHDVFALGQRTQSRALHGVAHIGQSHIVGGLEHLGLVGGKARVADAVVHAAVDVVGVQNHDVALIHRSGVGGKTDRGQRHRHDRSQQQGNCLFHLLPPSKSKARAVRTL
ncbi:hypothetical protein SDC9_121281 [bioreactor metagenome]|uniref:NAD-specific glutamate dehydrogenase n=1 Tax=bioreactor metagenome TaxID=1076179 RepID=A0A645CBJ3_9ZZZZ